MSFLEERTEVSLRSINGIAFLLAATVVWSVISLVFFLPLPMDVKNIYMLFSTGIMFPLAVFLSNFLKADWKLAGSPLARLALILNLAQIIYFPILFFIMVKSPTSAVIVFAIITGAHFFPYGWLYKAKAYFIVAPAISLTVMVLGLFLKEDALWIVPITMIAFFLLLSLLLYLDYKKKAGL